MKTLLNLGSVCGRTKGFQCVFALGAARALPELHGSTFATPTSSSYRNSGSLGRAGSLCVDMGRWSEMGSSVSSVMTTVPPGTTALE